jgi:heme oxygenase (biliverdin-IX-beta and delta-forming)
VESVSTLITKLNLATRAWHADVDDPWLALMSPTVSHEDYVTQLVQVYGLVAPFESASRYTPGIAKLLDYRQLMRAGLIAQDLLALGFTPPAMSRIPTCPAITVFRDTGEALGWLYVIERSTLLQEGVRRHLLDVLPSVTRACSYLSMYEGLISDHWQSLGRLFDREAMDAGMESSIIEAAEAAFSHAKQWWAVSRSQKKAHPT